MDGEEQESEVNSVGDKTKIIYSASVTLHQLHKVARD